VVADRGGSATVAWRCLTSKLDCRVYGEQGSVYSGFAAKAAPDRSRTLHVGVSGGQRSGETIAAVYRTA